MIKWKSVQQGYSDRLETLAGASPYEVLGVSSDADDVSIKSAYIALVKKHHPDKSDPFMYKYNQEVLKIVNTSYQTIKRDRHDR